MPPPLPEQYGPLLVFLNVLVEQLGAPVPAVPMLIAAGALSVGGAFSAATIVALAVLASGIADFAWFLAGRRHGRRILGLVCRITVSPDSCVRGTENVFLRWGAATLLVARFVPGVSSVSAPLAGAMGMGAPRFLFFDSLGTTAWATLFVGAGVVFHAEIDLVLAKFSGLGITAFGVLAALLLVYLTFRWVERRRLVRFVRGKRIDAAGLGRLIHAGTDPIVLDVRSAAARDADPRRLPGAKEVALDDLRGGLRDVPLDRDIVLFCSCPNEASAAKGARLLMRQGYQRVHVLSGGVEGWFAAAATAVEDRPDRL